MRAWSSETAGSIMLYADICTRVDAGGRLLLEHLSTSSISLRPMLLDCP